MKVLKSTKLKKLRKVFAIVMTVMVLSSFACLFVAAEDAAAADPQVDGAAVVGEIFDIMGSGVSGAAEVIGGGLSQFGYSIFFNSTGNLSAFGVLIIVFGSISLVLGLCYFVVNFLTSWGN